MRFSKLPLWSLMVAIVVIGSGFAALKNSSDLVASAVLTLAVGLFCGAFITAVSTNGRRRAIWLSFALFGTLYLGLTFRPDFSTTSFRPPTLLLTNWVSISLEYLRPRVLPPPILDPRFTPAEDYLSFQSNVPPNRVAVTVILGQRELDYLAIGNRLAALLIGFLSSLATILITAFKRGPAKP